ncbi:MAG: MBL fold metallo-hydrolase [Actinobacteria bacterium]|nr:MBL fold metallo-hydrolase [Actinomycetota bacterium]
MLGDGFGECVVVETDERVAIVDSALGPDGAPLPLAYLRAAGRSPDEVDLVVATHFDLDHVAGLASVMRALTPNRLVISGVFRNVDLLAEIAYQRRIREGDNSALPSRSAEILGAMEAAAPGALFFAGEGTRCGKWEGSMGELAFQAWAPATAAIDRIHRRIARRMAAAMRGSANALTRAAFRENEISIVLSISGFGTEVVLCGDLEASADGTRGWERAVSIGRDLFSVGMLDLVKVAHHGSAGAVDSALWGMASPRCIAIVAPWVRGRGVLPSQTEIVLLCHRAARVWLTVDPASLPVGPAGGRCCAPTRCWTQAVYDGKSWTVHGGEDAREFVAAPSGPS